MIHLRFQSKKKILALALEQDIHPFENVPIKEPGFLELFFNSS